MRCKVTTIALIRQYLKIAIFLFDGQHKFVGIAKFYYLYKLKI